MTIPGPDPETSAPAQRPRSLLGQVVLWLRRLALAGSQLALVLPFVSVEDCDGGEPVPYTGVKLLFERDGWFLAGPLLVAVILLVLSFRSRPARAGWRAFGSGVGALFVAAAGLVAAIWPHFVWLFDTVRPQAGWYVAVACWAFLYLEALGSGLVALRAARGPKAEDLWDPVCRALRWVALVVPWPVALLVEPDLHEALLGAGLVTAAVAVPLWVALSGCVGGLRQREPWAAGWAPFVAAVVAAAMALSSVAAAMQ